MEKVVAARTEDLSETPAPFPAGTKVRLRVLHAGANFTGQGMVAFSRPNGGMGTTVHSPPLHGAGAW